MHHLCPGTIRWIYELGLIYCSVITTLSYLPLLASGFFFFSPSHTYQIIKPTLTLCLITNLDDQIMTVIGPRMRLLRLHSLTQGGAAAVKGASVCEPAPRGWKKKERRGKKKSPHLKFVLWTLERPKPARGVSEPLIIWKVTGYGYQNFTFPFLFFYYINCPSLFCATFLQFWFKK